MNKLVVLATVCLIGAHGDPDPQEREVNPLSSLQQQQPAPSWNFQYGGAQGFANPYMRLNFGQHQPSYNPYMPQMPPSFGISGGLNWNGGYPQIGGSAGYYPYGMDYPNNGIESSTTKPDYADKEDDESKSGVEIIENGNNVQNNGLNWNQPSWNQPWQNSGMSYGPPQWSQSYTPVGGGCYNRCKPSCSFRPSPPPPPPPMPRPRPMPLPIPRPRPMPSTKPTYGCRSQCRPMCNQTPTCGAGASFNGNTMVCNRNRPQPSYNQGLYGGYGNYNSMYGGMMNTLPAKDPRSQPVAAKSVEAEAVVPSEEEEEAES